MSNDDETYCRLCAEPTPKDQLISTEDPVGINSKIAIKMQWINIDVSPVNTLPNTICFACFDALERTWLFLHNTRKAQDKLNEIYTRKQNAKTNEKIDVSEVGKPVNTNWEDFEKVKTEVKDESGVIQLNIVGYENIELDGTEKPVLRLNESTKDEIKAENNNLQLINDATGLIDINSLVKLERFSDNENNSEGYNSTDSNLPLLSVVRKKSKKKKKINKLDLENSKSCPSLTWDEYMCRCAYCDALCKNIMSLRLHTVQIHSCCCSFKCSECGKVISNYRLFIRHVRIHKKLLRRCCEFCNKRFPMSSSLKMHISMCHRDAYLMMCQSCGSSFDSTELLEDHIILYNRKMKKRALKCEQIEYDLKCELCNKEFKTKSNLQQHKLVHMERTREFSCHVCGKMFFTKGSLSTHIATHEDSRPYKCEFCPMAFRARGNLQSHRSLHSGVKPFVCEQCGKSFRVKRHLKSHSIVHTDLMPYVCEYCNKTFRFKTRLNLHLRQHTGVKPYNCILCQRDFTNGSNFKKHMKRRHNIDTSRKKYNNIVDDNVESKNELSA